MGGAAQWVAEAEPMEFTHSWQQTGWGDHIERTKCEEGIDEHVVLDAGEPKARVSTHPPEAGAFIPGAQVASVAEREPSTRKQATPGNATSGDAAA
ncbi:MAG TPA: hypothetical protein VH660_03515 [Candidatus Deferrimicrobiaceae bacterium]|jgi:hypothetical protein